jgi:hypothetical protein
MAADVICPAAKSPDASLATMALTVLVDVAVVALLATFPAPVMAGRSPSTIGEDVSTPSAPARTTPVLRLETVRLDALITPVPVVVRASPPVDVIPVTVTCPAAKFPDASLATIAPAVFASVALVVVLGNCEDDDVSTPPAPAYTMPAPRLDTVRLETLITPVPLVVRDKSPADVMPVAVIRPTSKFPDASLATIALAVFVDVAVVALLATFPPVVICASFVSVMLAVDAISASTIWEEVSAPPDPACTMPVPKSDRRIPYPDDAKDMGPAVEDIETPPVPVELSVVVPALLMVVVVTFATSADVPEFPPII